MFQLRVGVGTTYQTHSSQNEWQVVCVSESICLSESAAAGRCGAPRCTWPSRLTLRSHLLFSCCPAEGSSRRPVPSGKPQASTPDKASRVKSGSQLLPLHTEADTKRYGHPLTSACRTPCACIRRAGRTPHVTFLFSFIRLVIHSSLYNSFTHRCRRCEENYEFFQIKVCLYSNSLLQFYIRKPDRFLFFSKTICVI